MAFTESEILEFLNYAKDNGAAKTCRRFNVSLSSVRRWNAHYKIYQKQTPRVFSDDEKRAALKYAAKFGMSQAERVLGISKYHIAQWSEVYTSYNIHKEGWRHLKGKKYNKVTCEKKVAILEHVKQFGLIATSRKYDIPVPTLQRWNGKYAVYEPRKKRFFTPEQRNEILDYAAKHSIGRACLKFDIARNNIVKWKNASGIKSK